jgi:hypothetical protein
MARILNAIRIVSCVAALAFLLSHPSTAWAACTVTSCKLTVPDQCTVQGHVPFHWDYTVSGSCSPGWPRGVIQWGNGETSDHNDDTHVFYAEGTYNWELWIFDEAGNKCIDRGVLTIVPSCQMTCSVAASIRPGTEPPTVDFTPQISWGDCTCYYSGAERYIWRFYSDGIQDGMSFVARPTNAFTGDPPYTWKLDYQNNNNSTCVSEGTVETRECLTIGKLKLCAEEITRQPGADAYLLRGDVTIDTAEGEGDGLIFITESARFDGNPATGEGLLSTPGQYRVRRENGGWETLLKGDDVRVDGPGGCLMPSDQSGAYACTLAGIPLYCNGRPITLGEDGVRLEPTLFVGAASFALATAKTTLLYGRDGTKNLLKTEVLLGDITPSIQFTKLELVYAGKDNVLTGTGSINFPFLEIWSLAVTLRFKTDCSLEGGGINGYDIEVGLPVGAPLGTTGLEIVALTLKVDNICDRNTFSVFFGGNLGITGIADEILSLVGMGLGYTWPYTLVIEGGDITFLGYPLAGISGQVRTEPGHVKVTIGGAVDLAGILAGSLVGSLEVSQIRMTGTLRGKLQLPNFSCGWYNVPCRTLRSILRASVGLPILLTSVDTSLNLGRKASLRGWEAEFRGIPKVGPLSLAVILRYEGRGFTLLVGTNYQNVVQIHRDSERWPESAQETWVLDEPLEQVLFAAAANSESGPIPSVALTAPDGSVITPANVSSFPGIAYSEDAEGKVAVFRVDAASAGSWTLAAANLSVSEVTFAGLGPVPPPVTTFGEVTAQNGHGSIQAAIAPASPETKVSFFYSRLSSGAAGEAIALDLSAASGTVGVPWDLTGVPSGTYFVFAKTDDQKNPPIVTYYSKPVAVVNGALLPPTGLSGVRSGDTVDLSWTPSASADAKGYKVLYADQPEVMGYPFEMSATDSHGARVAGLDPAKEYRFAVQAIDISGNLSPESTPWQTHIQGIPGDCDGNGTTSIGEVQKAINMFLGSIPPGCGVDCSEDGVISIGEVQKVINAFLGAATSC